MAFKAELEKWIPWRDGAEVKLMRLSKAEERELEKIIEDRAVEIRKRLEPIKDRLAADFQEAADNMAAAAGKAKTDKDKLDYANAAKKLRENATDPIGYEIRIMSFGERLHAAIRDWRGIVDAEDKPIVCAEATKNGLLQYMVEDSDFLDKAIAFLRGPLGNLKSGLIASSNGGGTQESAINASAKK